MKFGLVKFKPKQIKGLECLNCTQPLMGNENFCSYCGQKNTTKKLSFGVFLSNLFEGLFSYDSRFWRTFIPLLLRPGKVSKEFIEGKRAKFVNPFQMYLNVSVVFFLLLGITNKIDSDNNANNNFLESTKNLDSLAQIAPQKLDSVFTIAKDEVINAMPNDSTASNVVTNFGDVFKIIETESDKDSTEYIYHIKSDTTGSIGFFNKLNDFQHYHNEYPTYNNETGLDSLGYQKTFWNKFYYLQIIKANENFKQLRSDGGERYKNKLTSYISISLFIFLPIFTLFLKLLFIRRKFTYMEHLVFVFHTQTVFFLLLVIFYLLNFFIEMESVIGIFVILFLIYLYKALRLFYQQGRFKTFVKFILLNSYYMFLALVGFSIVAVLSFLIS
jgi:hypothetical protein